MARRKKPKTAPAKIKKDDIKSDETPRGTSKLDKNDSLNTSGGSELSLSIEECDLVRNYSKTNINVDTVNEDNKLEDATPSVKSVASCESYCMPMTETVVVDLAEDFSPVKEPKVIIEEDLRKMDSTGLVPEEIIHSRGERRRDSESSEEYEYSAEASEPINIEEMIGGAVPSIDSAYLLYDTVLNSALRSIDVSSTNSVDSSKYGDAAKRSQAQEEDQSPSDIPSGEAVDESPALPQLEIEAKLTDTTSNVEGSSQPSLSRLEVDTLATRIPESSAFSSVPKDSNNVERQKAEVDVCIDPKSHAGKSKPIKAELCRSQVANHQNTELNDESVGDTVDVLDKKFKCVVNVDDVLSLNVSHPRRDCVEPMDTSEPLSTSVSTTEYVKSGLPEASISVKEISTCSSDNTIDKIVIQPETKNVLKPLNFLTTINKKCKRVANREEVLTDCASDSVLPKEESNFSEHAMDVSESASAVTSREWISERTQNFCGTISNLKIVDDADKPQQLNVPSPLKSSHSKTLALNAVNFGVNGPETSLESSELNSFKGVLCSSGIKQSCSESSTNVSSVIIANPGFGLDTNEVPPVELNSSVGLNEFDHDAPCGIVQSKEESNLIGDSDVPSENVKLIGALRPRRQTRQPKRIADAFDPRQGSKTPPNPKQSQKSDAVVKPPTSTVPGVSTKPCPPSPSRTSPVKLQTETSKPVASTSKQSLNSGTVVKRGQPQDPSNISPKSITTTKSSNVASVNIPLPESPSSVPPLPTSPSKSLSSSSPLKSSSPVRPPSPQSSKVVKLAPSKSSPKKTSSASPASDQFPKSTAKLPLAAKTAKNATPPKPPATKAAVKAYPKNLPPPRTPVPSKGALKAMTPKVVNKPTAPRPVTPKGAKTVAKAAAKMAVDKVKEEGNKPGDLPVEEPMEVEGNPPKVEEPIDSNNDFNGSVSSGLCNDASKTSKTLKPETKKEAVPKKPENVAGTRRRSNRIRINRWDDGPALLAAALASSAQAAVGTNGMGSPAALPSTSPSSSSNTAFAPNSKEAELPPPLLPASFEADKPVKVKSRWRRTSELEMGAGTMSVATSLATPQIHPMTPEGSVPSPAATLPPALSPTPPPMPPSGPEMELPPPPPPPPPPPAPSESPTPKPPYEIDHPEIAERLKGFEIIKENMYLTARHVNKENKRMVCECTLTEEDMARGEPGCGEHCLNRLLMIECSHRCTLGNLCSNKRFQNCEYSKCTVVRTLKKGLGLIASTSIPGGEFLMEYIGEVLDPKEFRRRAKDYAKEKNRHYYFMELKSGAIIDATVKGNISRFINHSCDPNAETQKWTVNGELRIGFFSKRPISKNEEVTFDYQFQRYGKEAQRCFCGSSNCRGWIGEDPEKEDKDEKDKSWSKAKDKKEKKKTREELEEEIEKLRLSGIKNRAHTLMLNRLMVRAEDHSSRSQLLAITQSGVDQRCLRLFLDYHGLNLLWSWMVDSTAPTSLKVQILDTFSVLPITNKTILQDSKVLGVVERWAKKGVAAPCEKTRRDEESSSPDSEETSDGSATAKSEVKIEETLDPSDAERRTVVAKAVALCQTWMTLKEEFRIPKKEKIEQMKEHEREADRGYVDHEKAMKSEPSYDRHWNYDKDASRSKRRGRDSPDSADWKSRSGRGDDRNGADSSGPRLSKMQRRQLFEMKVEEEERQKRLEEERWANHQEQCYALGVDPNMTYPPQHNGFYHPLVPDGSEMPSDMYGQGGMGHPPPQRYPPPPSPFLPPGGPPLSPAFPPPFHQMGLGPPGPSPPLGHPSGMGPPPPPSSQGMGPHPGMGPSVPPPGMGPPGPPPGMGASVPPLQMGPPGAPPGMLPTGMGTNVMVPPGGPSPFGPPPHGIPPFPPGGIPPPGVMPVGPLPGSMPPFNPPLPTPPQPGYPAPPFLPGAPLPTLEPPPNDVMNLNNPAPPLPANVPAVIMIKLPKNWKITVDKERKTTYYYHAKTRHVQWTFPSVQEVAEEEAKCAGMKSSGKYHNAEDSDDTEEEEEESESEEEESTSDEYEEKDDEEDDEDYDESILAEARRKAREELMIQTVVTEPRLLNSTDAVTSETQVAEGGTIIPGGPESYEPALKKKRDGLVTVNIISPRDEDEDYRKGIKKSKIKETKMKLARQKARAKAKAAAIGSSGKSKSKKAKTCEADTSSGPSRKIKDKFRVQMANVIVTILNPYRKADCKVGRIMNTEDFKHLARKLTHFVMVKELRHVASIEDLQCNDNVKHKARDFIRKYMSKFGAVYSRSPDD